MQIVLLVCYAFGLSVGQLLFKMAAMSVQRPASWTASWLLRLLLDPYFVAAAVLYVGLSLLWVWMLSFIPLSRAYPFVALSILLTPLWGHLLFGEALGKDYLLGLVLIVAGLLLVVHR
ncbi:MAG: EamA family transporter [Burkholderiales bacterium]|nr:EamA family transporter [Burkholderiales bacterium]